MRVSSDHTVLVRKAPEDSGTGAITTLPVEAQPGHIPAPDGFFQVPEKVDTIRENHHTDHELRSRTRITMSLVIAFIGSDGAVIAGDLREILMAGPDAAICRFEQELYSGQIRTDSDLKKRAVENGIILHLRDDKCKLSDHEGILIGEVAESEGDKVRRRRLCVACGTYAIIDIDEDESVLKQRGGEGTFVILGNEITKRIAHAMIQSEWKSGTFPDAVRLIIRIMNAAASSTASVSRAYTILQTRKKTELDITDLINRKI